MRGVQKKEVLESSFRKLEDDKSNVNQADDVGLHVLGCRVDILGTNCNVNQANIGTVLKATLAKFMRDRVGFSEFMLS